MQSILPLAAVLTLPLAVFASKGVAPLFVAAAVAAIFGHIAVHRSFPSVSPLLGAFLGAFLAFAGASAFWSLTPQRTVEAAVPLAGILLGTAVLAKMARDIDETARNRMRRWLAVGVAAGVALLLIEAAVGRPMLSAAARVLGLSVNTEIWMLKPATTVAVMLFWPALIAMRGISMHPLVQVAAAAVLLAAIAWVGSDAGILGFFVAVAVFLSALFWQRTVGRVIGAVVAVAMLTAPLIPGLLPDPRESMKGIEYLPNSAIHRIFIWQTTAKHIAERPLLGHGLDTARNLYPQSTFIEFSLAKKSVGGLQTIRGEPIPLHPHNIVLQIWLELGAVGAALALGAILAILRILALAPLDASERAAGYALFVGSLTIATVSYGAWQAWWLSAMGLCGVFFVAVCSLGRRGLT